MPEPCFAPASFLGILPENIQAVWRNRPRIPALWTHPDCLERRSGEPRVAPVKLGTLLSHFQLPQQGGKATLSPEFGLSPEFQGREYTFFFYPNTQQSLARVCGLASAALEMGALPTWIWENGVFGI